MSPMLRVFTALCSLITAGALLTGCSSTPPSDPANLCSIFQEKDSWYVAAHRAHERYGVPINVAMAILNEESAFLTGPRPAQSWFLFVPYDKEGTNYGYIDPLNPAWLTYVSEHGNVFTSHENFEDVLMYVAWFMRQTRTVNEVPFTDAYNHYLNFHEGWQGFKDRSYANKDWLLTAARRVQENADRYARQLMTCNLY